MSKATTSFLLAALMGILMNSFNVFAGICLYFIMVLLEEVLDERQLSNIEKHLGIKDEES